MSSDVAVGSKADVATHFGLSAVSPKADIKQGAPNVRFVPITDIYAAASAALFDRLVSALSDDEMNAAIRADWLRPSGAMVVTVTN